MKRRPLLLPSSMAQPLLYGLKTRVSAPLPPVFNSPPDLITQILKPGDPWRGLDALFGGKPDEWGIRFAGMPALPLRCPYGVPKDQLWLREKWRPAEYEGARAMIAGIEYEADGAFTAIDDTQEAANRWVDVRRAEEQYPTFTSPQWHSSTQMPQWASRLLLEVVAVRIERLQDISAEDARAEGITIPRCGCEVCAHTSAICTADQGAYIDEFAALWERHHGDRAPWASNPWVWVADIKKVEG